MEEEPLSNRIKNLLFNNFRGEDPLAFTIAVLDVAAFTCAIYSVHNHAADKDFWSGAFNRRLAEQFAKEVDPHA